MPVQATRRELLPEEDRDRRGKEKVEMQTTRKRLGAKRFQSSFADSSNSSSSSSAYPNQP
jgi:hypothetical protein